MPREMNKVTIRAWIPRKSALSSIIRLNKPEMGHASLQTHIGGSDGKGIYASFWPEDPISLINPTVSAKREDECTLADDKSRCPDRLYEYKKVKFYMSDIIAISEAYRKFRNSNFNWGVFSSSFLAKKNSQNCAGLVYILLEAGGISQIIPKYKSIIESRDHLVRDSDINEKWTSRAAYSGLLLSLIPGAGQATMVGYFMLILLGHCLDVATHAKSNPETIEHARGSFFSIAGGYTGMFSGGLAGGAKFGAPGIIGGGILGLVAGQSVGGRIGAKLVITPISIYELCKAVKIKEYEKSTCLSINASSR